MTSVWGAAQKPVEPVGADVVQGVAGRYRCASISSIDVHLVQVAKKMIVCQSITEMDGLLADRDALLERRLEMQQAGKRPAAMPHLSDTA